MNSFLPAVQVTQTLKKLNLPVPPELAKELPDVVSKGLERIVNEQHEDGGWGWFGTGKPDPEMTTYVVYGLFQAREAGYEVPDQTLDRGLQMLMGQVGKIKDPSLRAYVVYVLSLSANHRDVLLKAALPTYDERDKLSPTGLAMLALTMQRLGNQDEAQVLLNLLAKHAHRAAAMAYWSDKAKYEEWSCNQVEITAWALRAFLALDPQHPLVAESVRFLVTHRRGEGWDSSKDTAAATIALAGYVSSSGEAHPRYRLQVWVNGSSVRTATVEPKDLDAPDLVIKLKAKDLRIGPNQIRIAKDGAGVLWYSAALRYYTTAEPVPSSGRDLTVRRSYWRLVGRTQRDGSITYVPVRLGEGEELRAGEVFEVRLDLRLRLPAEYVVVEDPLPAGCEVITEGDEYSWNYWWSGQEIHDDHMALFMRWANTGRSKLTYRLRAELPGDLHVMPTRIYGMYLPDLAGNGREDRMTVR